MKRICLCFIQLHNLFSNHPRRGFLNCQLSTVNCQLKQIPIHRPTTCAKPLPVKEAAFLFRQGLSQFYICQLTSASVMARISFFCWAVSKRMTLWILPSS